jgi:hypothetical protein
LPSFYRLLGASCTCKVVTLRKVALTKQAYGVFDYQGPMKMADLCTKKVSSVSGSIRGELL